MPTTIGKYQVIREIARSNDIVYEAYDPLMNRRVAVKELAVPGGSTPAQREDRVKRFQREVKAAGSLAHPNIVTIYEVGEDAGRHFMAMEYLDGHTLRNEIDTRGGLGVARAIEVAIDVLCALHFAHEHGVIHRDVKPDNIQILENGTVKLTDFGIARLTFEPSITMDGQVFGTPSYMSPEQVVGREIDLRSDVFSMGVVLYEMSSTEVCHGKGYGRRAPASPFVSRGSVCGPGCPTSLHAHQYGSLRSGPSPVVVLEPESTRPIRPAGLSDAVSTVWPTRIPNGSAVRVWLTAV